MTRRFPDCTERPEGHETGAVSSRSFVIQVVTPSFGGGAEPGVVDYPSAVIRGSSVRGHLRFWWRATKGAGADFVDTVALRNREGEIWGTTKIPSSVRIFIDVTNPGALVACAEKHPGDKTPRPSYGFPGYAIFPFYANGICNACMHAQFTLTLEYPPQVHQDVMAAVWAWVNFGGIGARTRRGCGSLYCRDLAPKVDEDVHQWYKKKLVEYKIPVEGTPEPWSCLPAQFFIKRDKGDSVKIWNQVIGLLQKFRPGRGTGRNQGQGRPGRSFWPEADSIRRITKELGIRKGLSSHEKTITTVEDAFPRSEFGLPIIYHFTEKGNRDEPKDTNVLPNVDYAGSKKQKRMASPLIIKPLAVSMDSAVPLVLRLNVSPLSNVALEVKMMDGTAWYVGINGDGIRNPMHSRYTNSPIENRTENGSALDAFLAFVREEGYHGG